MEEKKILVLCRGMIAGPCIEFLLCCEYNTVTVPRLVRGRPRVTAIPLDVTDSDLDGQIAAHNLVISLANVAISGHISTSLEAVVKKAGTAVLYEIGVDPRTHQLYAPRHITSIHAMGGKVDEFCSHCSPLPFKVSVAMAVSKTRQLNTTNTKAFAKAISTLKGKGLEWFRFLVPKARSFQENAVNEKNK
ncbi:unnamed protein product [Clonostachys rosea f. rosea IK726]|uniref:Uncharacterized protein n=1 Tax=Clonostachys rosea f. rosea IK726 TaxID=1349383 RepID=A0ACA9U101_BIOOC|nr:unnamed protein product [Clonostachys rosea f. rosea IK726]